MFITSRVLIDKVDEDITGDGWGKGRARPDYRKDPECQAVHGDWFLVDKKEDRSALQSSRVEGHSRAECRLAQGCLGFRSTIWLGVLTVQPGCSHWGKQAGG